MKTNVIVKLQIEGLHHWPGVVEEPKLEQVHFLKSVHRHIFHITAKKEVKHSDRDIEIIVLKRNILNYLQKRYWAQNANTHYFDSMSCEMIATELAMVFGLKSCEVLEDGENGAEFIQGEITNTEVLVDGRIEYTDSDGDKYWVDESCGECNEKKSKKSKESDPSYQDYLEWLNNRNMNNNRVSTTFDKQLKFTF